MSPQTAMEKHFDQLGIYYKTHCSTLIETWMREVQGLKLGVVWYDTTNSILWIPRNRNADILRVVNGEIEIVARN